jgi:hypothetical protein
MRSLFVLALAAFYVPYLHVQSTAEVVSSPVSKYVTVKVHLRNIGDTAAACVVKAGGKRRETGVSIGGEAEVTFDALSNYKSYTVTCSAN